MGTEIENRTEENYIDDINMEKNMNDDKIVQQLIEQAETLENGKSLSEKKKRKKKKKKLEVTEDDQLASSCVEDPVVADVVKGKSLSNKDEDLVTEGEASAPQRGLTPTESEETENGKSLPETKKSRRRKKKQKALAEVELESSCVEDPVAKADDTTSHHAVTPSESEETISKKKKKKKLKRSASEANIDTNVSKINVASTEGKMESVPEEVVTTDTGIKKKRKKLKKSADEANYNARTASPSTVKSIHSDIKENGGVVSVKESMPLNVKVKCDMVNGTSPTEIQKVVDSETSMVQPNVETTKSLKKKKKKKEMYRIDSDIAFNAPSLSKINLLEAQSSANNEIPTKNDLPTIKDTSNAVGDTNCNTSDSKLTTVKDVNTPLSRKKKKMMKKYNAETSLLAHSEQVTPVVKNSKCNLDLDSPKNESGATPKSSKVFDEDNSWDDPLKPGETEIVLPNKNYKGSLKLSEPAKEMSSDSLALNGMITPAKSYTSTFLKTAMSKSADGKKRKKDKDHTGKNRCMSEPRQKKVNIVLTQNKSQDIPSHLQSVKNSPQTPHDPHKNPVKGVLKKRVSLESGARLNPVQLNTQLNGRSKAAKVLVGKKRKSAMDFFLNKC